MAATVRPLSPGRWDAARVADAYHAHGFVHLPGLYSAAALEPMVTIIHKRIDAIAEALGEPRRADLPLGRRLPAILRGRSSEHLTGMPSPFNVGGGATDDDADEEGVFRLVTHPPLLELLAVLLGDTIQYDNAGICRSILPQTSRPRDRTTQGFPQHTDSQYFDTTLFPDSGGAVEPGHPLSSAPLHIVAAWVPLVDCDERSSCLTLIPGSHHHGDIVSGKRDGFSNMDSHEDVEARFGPAKPVPCKAGDCVLFHNLVFHGSSDNSSDRCRWSLDFRYTAPARSLPAETRAAANWYSDTESASRGRAPIAVSGEGAANTWPLWRAQKRREVEAERLSRAKL